MWYTGRRSGAWGSNEGIAHVGAVAVGNKPTARNVTRWPSLLRGVDVLELLARPFRGPAAIQGETQTLAGRLGYGPDVRLLIVHADDLGLAHSVNAAFFAGLETGLINSGSVMVPSPWFAEVAAFARAHPEADLGLHLTLTSEQPTQRWRPVADPALIPSLVDPQGLLRDEWAPESPVSPGEVEIELRAQIARAIADGLRPTHLDSHQFRLQMYGRDLFELYLRLGREYRLPVLVAQEWFAKFPYLQPSLTPADIVPDRMVVIRPKITPEQPPFYRRTIETLAPGVTELLVHPGYDDDELRAVFEGQLLWGAAFRQREFQFFTGDEFRSLLAEHDIKLVTWREIARRLK